MQVRHDGGMALVGMAGLDAQDKNGGRGVPEEAASVTVLADAVAEAKRAVNQAQATALALAQWTTALHIRRRAMMNMLILC